MGPEPEFAFGSLEAHLSKGVERIIPIVAFGPARLNVDFVVADSHGGGTAKVTGGPGVTPSVAGLASFPSRIASGSDAWQRCRGHFARRNQEYYGEQPQDTLAKSLKRTT